MESKEFSTIPRFSGIASEFPTWKFLMMAQLKARGMDQLVKEKISEVMDPTITTDPAKKAWEKALADKKVVDSKCFALMLSALPIETASGLIACETSYDVWTKLLALYEQQSRVSKSMLLQKFYGLEYQPGETMAAYLARVEGLVSQLKSAGVTLDEVTVVTKVLGTLPPEYASVLPMWDDKPESEYNMVNLTASLTRQELRMTASVSSESRALAAKGQKDRNASDYKQSEKHSRPTKEKRKCYNCGKVGHLAAKCRMPKRRDASDKSSRKSQDDGEACMAGSSMDEWVADTGASHHMANNKDAFRSLKYIPAGTHPVKFGNGDSLDARGRGTIKIISHVDGQRIELDMLDVLYIPGLKRNLFSIGSACDKGLKANVSKQNIDLIRDESVRLRATKRGNLYYMDIEVSEEKSSFIAGVSRGDLWHQRLGHIGSTRFNKMKDVVKGLPANIRLDSIECEDCPLGKHARGKFSKSESKTSRPGELVHTDLCGPMEVSSPVRSRYFMVLKDDFSGYTVVYFLKSKSQEEVTACVKEYIVKLETETGERLKTLRSDNGLEFMNQSLAKILRDARVTHQTSVAYCPEQNGSAERENRSLQEMARTCLHARGLPKELWAEAVNCANYISNRIPKGERPLAPIEMWCGRKPSVSHVKVFGSPAMVFIPKEKRLKWDPKSARHIFVGYCERQKAYRFWDPIKRKITISRDAIIKELDPIPKFACEEELLEFNYEVINKVTSIGNEDASDAPDQMQATNSSRIPKPRSPYSLRSRVPHCESNFAGAFIADMDEPQTFEEAMSSPQATQWRKAMEEEIDSLKLNKTWELVDLPDRRRPVTNKWVYKIKRHPNGDIDRFKARLVARGYTQKKGIDYEETFSPVVKYDSVRALLAVATQQAMKIWQFDVKTAFLHGELEEEIYMVQPEGFTEDARVCRLLKSIYGLKQASRTWNQKFHQYLVARDYCQSDADPCVYYWTDSGMNIYLCLYVDDGLIASDSEELMNEHMAELERNFEIRWGEAKCYVGLHIERTRNGLVISQAHYIQDLLKRFNMEDANPVSTPIEKSITLSKKDSPATKDEIEEMKNIPYRQAVGALLFLATASRADISFAVGVLSQYLDNPGRQHWIAVKRLLKYLKGTKDLSLHFEKDTPAFELIGYCDADYAGCHDTRRSTSGSVFVLAGGAISWSSTKQRSVALSTTEAEYMAACVATKDAIWLRRLLKDLGASDISPTTLYCDNISAVRLASNPEFHKRTKHIEIQWHFVREAQANGLIALKHIESKKQLADLLTKGIARELLANMLKSLGCRTPEDEDNSLRGSDKNGH